MICPFQPQEKAQWHIQQSVSYKEKIYKVDNLVEVDTILKYSNIIFDLYDSLLN